MPDEALVRLVSDSIAANDPLAPCLVVSNFDQTYWDDIAANVAPEILRASSVDDVFDALAKALSGVVGLSDDPYARERRAAAARAIWRGR